MRFLLFLLQQLLRIFFIAVAQVFLLLLQGLPIRLVKILLVLVSTLDGLVIEEDIQPAVLVSPIEVLFMKHFAVVIPVLLLKVDGIVMPRRLVKAEQLFVVFGGGGLVFAGVVQGLDEIEEFLDLGLLHQRKYQLYPLLQESSIQKYNKITSLHRSLSLSSSW